MNIVRKIVHLYWVRTMHLCILWFPLGQCLNKYVYLAYFRMFKEADLPYFPQQKLSKIAKNGLFLKKLTNYFDKEIGLLWNHMPLSLTRLGARYTFALRATQGLLFLCQESEDVSCFFSRKWMWLKSHQFADRGHRK